MPCCGGCKNCGGFAPNSSQLGSSAKRIVSLCGVASLSSTKVISSQLPALTAEASISARTQPLLLLLDQHGGDIRGTWLSALRGLVLERNSHGEFDDILGHPWFKQCLVAPPQGLLDNISIAELSVLYEFLLSRKSMKTKRRNGQFFTPDDIAIFMAKRALRFPNGTWIDPCCGVGNLSHWLVACHPDPERFLLDQCKFVDIDDLALFTARVLKSLAFQSSERDLFTKLEPNFRVGDFLQESLLEPPPFVGEYDYVLMNPPYVQTADSNGQFASSASRDLYAFFLERALSNAKGMVAITPQTFTNGARHRDLRQVFINNCAEARIYCFDNVPDTVFRGFKFGSENSNQVNSTRAAISVTLRQVNGRKNPREIAITPLLRWRSSERAELLANADSYLNLPPGLGAQLFPKVMPGLSSRYEAMLECETRLSDIARVSPGRRTLNVPTTPRYFISATKRDLDRSSQTSLSFESEDDLLLAYLTLNSSLAYFWWRVRDGGMTLSRETLMSMPLQTSLDVRSDEANRLVKALRSSEKRNLVVKVNAGKPNENVKHPLSLIHRLNTFIASGDEDRLLDLHKNSVLDSSQ